MILKDKGLPNKKVKNISMSFKKALVTGALFASVAATGIGLTGCGTQEDYTRESTYEEPYEEPYESGHLILNEKVNFTVLADLNTKYLIRDFKYVIDELTGIVYLENANAGGITPALMIDEETGLSRVMTKADLEKILDYDMSSVEK